MHLFEKFEKKKKKTPWFQLVWVMLLAQVRTQP
jgi:hypothetical protein